MTKIIVRLEGHYEVHEKPFSRAYEWHPGCVTLECDCGQNLTLDAASTVSTCSRCGADHSDIIQDIKAREDRLRHEITHPWHYDTKEQSDQHLRDEAAHPKDSSWRYNDITSGNTNHV